MRRDIDEALQGWHYQPDPGEVHAREVRARDGRNVVQIRVELGILQMETEGRPDGLRPHGFASYLDYLRYRAAGRGQAKQGKSEPWTMSPEHCSEADREFVQYYHRRMAWLALQKYDRAVQDAEHTLALMDFVRRHGPNPDYVESHERYRGLVLFHKTQACAAIALDRRRPDESIDAIRTGLAAIRRHQADWDEEHDPEETPNGRFVEQLEQLEQKIREEFSVEKTLAEQLEEAVEQEDYERAAALRDQIRRRTQR
jgi:hypothetical protein